MHSRLCWLSGDDTRSRVCAIISASEVMMVLMILMMMMMMMTMMISA